MFALDTVKMLSRLGRDVFVKLLPKRRFSNILRNIWKKILDNLPFRLLHLRNSKLLEKNWLAPAHNLELKVA